jgi:AraC-like DNA-binding protein
MFSYNPSKFPPSPQKITFPNWLVYVRRTHSRPLGQLGELHFHPHYEIVWLGKGQAEFFRDFHRYPLQANTLAFIRPGDLHTWFGDWTQFHLDVVGFQPDVFGLWNTLPNLPFFEVDAAPSFTPPAAEQPIMEALFTRMLERSKQTNGDAAILAGYLYVLLLEIRRLYIQQVVNTLTSPAQTLASHFRRLLEEHYKERWLMKAYAERLSVTTNHLVKIIRQTTGQTPGQMSQERLFLEARRLLAYSNMTVQEISHELTFLSLTQFGQWFKKLAGKSPLQFRQEIASQFALHD